MKTLFINSKVWLKDFDFAESIGIDSESGKIIFIGKNIDANKKEFDEVIDTGNKLILPAFTDGHMHFIRGSLIRNEIDLTAASSLNDFENRFKAYRKNFKNARWITGGYFTETNFKENFIIDRNLLDKICPDIPVAISRIDLHSFVVNSLVIEISGIKQMIGKFGDDEIICDLNGNLTGEFKERAMYYILERIPKKTEFEIEEAVLNETERLFSFGIVSISDIFWKEYFDTYKNLLANKKLKLNTNAIIPLEDFFDFEKYKNEFSEYERNF